MKLRHPFRPGSGYGHWQEIPSDQGFPSMSVWVDYNEDYEGDPDEPIVPDLTFCPNGRHQLVDLDPGDPEVGPQPLIVCVKCGIENPS